MQNLIVALTNFPALLSIKKTLLHDDYKTCGILIFLTTWSVISHLIQNHKHNMPGIGNFSISTSKLTNYLDIVGSVLIGFR